MTICKFIFGYMINFEIKKVINLPRPMARQDSPMGEFERLSLMRARDKKEEVDKYYKDHPEVTSLEKGLKEINKKYL